MHITKCLLGTCVHRGYLLFARPCTRLWDIRTSKTLALPSWHFLSCHGDREENRYFREQILDHTSHGQMGHPETPSSAFSSGDHLITSAGRESWGGRGRQPFCSVQTLSWFSICCSLWLRTGHMIQTVPGAGLEVLVYRLSMCPVFANKKYLIGICCNNKASSAYI